VSQRVLEQVGRINVSRMEGLIRGAQWRDGAYRDGYLYAITRPDKP
jgi:RimJ/RimL family protein N-acetyltransferase